MDKLILKIGCKIILIHNIDTSDGLTNGQLGHLKEVIRTEDGSISKCIIKFKNEKVGRQSRAKNQQFAAKYPKGTVILISINQGNTHLISLEGCTCNNST